MGAPFLTDIDSRAAVKGSRDPLGTQSIWTKLGRHVVGNLTTVTTSVRDFTTTILGVAFAARLREEGNDGDVAAFLKWEQIAAYARAWVNKDYAFRGTERVRARLSDGARVYISAKSEHQILSNQKIYGLWGLFLNASRDSAIVELDPARPSAASRAMIEEVVLPILGSKGVRDGAAILDVLRKERAPLDLDGRDARMVAAVAAVLQRRITTRERTFYRDHLLHGGPSDHERTKGEQRQLVEILDDVDDIREGLTSPLVEGLAREARKRRFSALADHLDRIKTCEAVLAPAVRAFIFLLARDGQTLDGVAFSLAKTWGKRVGSVDPSAFAALVPELEGALQDVEAAQRWRAISEALAVGEYRRLVELVLEQNRFVMTSRGGAAPWARVENGKLRVRFQEIRAELPTREELPRLWISPYFLNSLRLVAHELRRGAA